MSRKPSKTNPVPKHIDVIADTPVGDSPTVSEPRTRLVTALEAIRDTSTDPASRSLAASMLAMWPLIEAEAAQPIDVERHWKGDALAAFHDYLRQHGMGEGSDAFRLLSATLNEAHDNARRRAEAAQPIDVALLADRLIEGQRKQGGPVRVDSTEDAQLYAAWLLRHRTLSMSESRPVHNHGPEEGPGLACHESLIGDCIEAEAAQPIDPDASWDHYTFTDPDGKTTVSEPRTEAGRALLNEWTSEGGFILNRAGLMFVDRILAIEAEAAQPIDVERLVAEAMLGEPEGDNWDDEVRMTKRVLRTLLNRHADSRIRHAVARLRASDTDQEGPV